MIRVTKIRFEFRLTKTEALHQQRVKNNFQEGCGHKFTFVNAACGISLC